MQIIKLKPLISLIVAMGVISSCTKQRPEIEPQGQNLDDLVSIAEVHNKTCTITTARAENNDMIQTQAYSGSSARPRVEANDFNIKFLEIVKIEKTDCPSVMEAQEALEFRGEPGKTYNMIYRVSPNYLTLYKVLPKDEVSHYEIPYSDVHQGTYYVPVGGFEIEKFFVVERAKNSDNRKTNEKKKFPVDKKNYTKASHLSIDKLAMMKFVVVEKTDVLPKSFFGGEWYYNKTRVKTKHNKKDTVGTLEAHDTNYGASSRVKFHFQKDQLFALNVNIDEKLLEDESNIELEETLKIPVSSVDYRRAKKGESLEFKEERLEGLKVSEAKYLELSFENTATAGHQEDSFESIFSVVERLDDSKQVLELEIGQDFFTYLVEDGGNQELVRYSFKRVPEKSTYEPRVAFKEDWERFGFFKSLRAQISDHRTVRNDDLNQRILMNRFDPKKPIVYRFSRLTPRGPENEWIRDTARESVNFWQQAFEKASGENRTFITLQESCEKPHPEHGCDVALGDIRYNVINLIDVSQAGALGFGPSLQDTLTGEIIAATANATLFDIRELQYSRMRDYIAQELGYLADFAHPLADNGLDPKIFSLMATMDHRLYANQGQQLQPLEFYRWTDNSQQEFSFGPLVDPEIFGRVHKSGRSRVNLAEVGSFQEFAATVTKANLYENDFSFGTTFRFGASSRTSAAGKAYVDFITANCPTVVAFINQYKDAPSLPNTKTENEALAPCVRQRLMVDLLVTLTHEIGHNLGLRHNLQGSIDKDNYAPEGSFAFKYIKPIKSIMRSKVSSIMDYESPHHTQTVHPGLYDIAALRYGYFNKIEVVSPDNTVKTLSVPSDTSIDRFAAKNNVRPKPYRFCTDEHQLEWTASTCDYDDYGTTPLEIAEEVIRVIYGQMNSGVFRYDRLGASEFNFMGYMIKLKRIYEDWRALVSQEVGASNKYLSGISVQSYESTVARVLAKHGKKAEDLLKARNLIFNTLVDLAFIPNRYCVVNSPLHEGSFFYEMSKVRADLINDGYTGDLTRCTDDVALSYFKDRKLSVEKEVGHYLFSDSFNLNPANLTKDIDFGGIALVRLNALVTLLSRHSLSSQAISTDFSPNFVDEPDLRALFGALFEGRILGGAFISDQKYQPQNYSKARLLKAEDVIGRFKNNFAMPNFKEEHDLIVALYEGYMEALEVPGNLLESQSRQSPYQVGTAQNLDLVGNIADSYQVDASLWAWTSTANGLASRMMDILKANDLRQQISAIAPNLILEGLQRLGQSIASSPTAAISVKELFDQFVKIDNELNQLKSEPKPELIGDYGACYNLLTFGLPPALEISPAQFNALLSAYVQLEGDVSKLPPGIQEQISSPIPKEQLIQLIEHTKADTHDYHVKQALFATEYEAQRNIILGFLSVESMNWAPIESQFLDSTHLPSPKTTPDNSPGRQLKSRPR